MDGLPLVASRPLDSGAPVYGFTADRCGRANSALDMPSGASTYFTAAVSGLPSGSGARSATVWVRCAPTPDFETAFLQYGIRTSNHNSGLLNAHGSLHFVGEYNDVSASVAVCDNKWHHAAFVYTGRAGGSKLSLYLDGAVVKEQNISALETTQSPLNIGWYPLYNANGFHVGQLDSVYVYNTALTAAQIAELHAKDACFVPPVDPQDPSDSALLIAGPGGWSCVRSVFTPVRLSGWAGGASSMLPGDAECFSEDGGRNCVWAVDDAGCHALLQSGRVSATASALSCGVAHARWQSGMDGYNGLGHWCVVARVALARPSEAAELARLAYAAAALPPPCGIDIGLLPSQLLPSSGSSSLQSAGWRCVVGLPVPVRLHTGDATAGDPECLSLNGRTCEWAANDAACVARVLATAPLAALRPLICGVQHAAIYGDDSYAVDNSWCLQARVALASREEAAVLAPLAARAAGNGSQLCDAIAKAPAQSTEQAGDPGPDPTAAAVLVTLSFRLISDALSTVDFVRLESQLRKDLLVALLISPARVVNVTFSFSAPVVGDLSFTNRQLQAEDPDDHKANVRVRFIMLASSSPADPTPDILATRISDSYADSSSAWHEQPLTSLTVEPVLWSSVQVCNDGSFAADCAERQQNSLDDHAEASHSTEEQQSRWLVWTIALSLIGGIFLGALLAAYVCWRVRAKRTSQASFASPMYDSPTNLHVAPQVAWQAPVPLQWKGESDFACPTPAQFKFVESTPKAMNFELQSGSLAVPLVQLPLTAPLHPNSCCESPMQADAVC